MVVKFDVAYYDETEEGEFEQRGLDGNFADLVENGLELDEFELLAVGLFNEQGPDDGFRSRDDLRRKVPRRLAIFEDYFTTEESTLRARRAPDVAKFSTEWMGVAGALAASEKAFGLHAADWVRLSIGQSKDLDFEVASTGTNYIVVEAKGAVVDNVHLRGTLSEKKRDIKDKKAVQRPLREGDVLLGVITAIPREPGQRARVWLVDPPAPSIEEDPYRFKLRARLSYYRELLRALGRPHLLIALTNRLREFSALSDWSALDGVPLVNADDEPYGVPPSFTSDRSHSVDGRLVVITIPVSDGVVLLGLDMGVIPVIVRQKFDQVNRWRSRRAGRTQVAFRLLLSPEELEGFSIDGVSRDELGRPRWVLARCDVHVAESGFVLGVLSNSATITLLGR